jgi:hypothetical protein
MTMQIRWKEQTTNRRRIPFRLVDSATGLVPQTGKTGSVRYSKNGTTSAGATNAIVEIDSVNMAGAYYWEPTAAELDTEGLLEATITPASCAPAVVRAMIVGGPSYGIVSRGTLSAGAANTFTLGGDLANVKPGDTLFVLGKGTEVIATYNSGTGAGTTKTNAGINNFATSDIYEVWTGPTPYPLGATDIGTGAIGATQIAAGALTSSAFATGAITSTVLAPGAITSTVLANNAITSSILAANAIGSSQLATGAITSTQFAAGAINAAAIASAALTTAKFGSGAIDSTVLNATAITAINTALLGTAFSSNMGSLTLQQIIALTYLACIGKVSGLSSSGGTAVVRNAADLANAISLTIDANGNRTASSVTVASL